MTTDPILDKLIAWAQPRPDVRAAVLTSTRTNPNAPQDLFSDYDILYVVTDIQPYFEDRSWLFDFGPMLVVYRDPIKVDPEYGGERFAYITQYETGLKIDFSLFSLPLWQAIAADPTLPPDLDVGYQVLLDKDGLTHGMPAPSYRAYIPQPPTQAEYDTLVENFFHEATYVVKHLWRDDLLPAKYNLDYSMKHMDLRKMLEWRYEIDHNWSLKTGAYGKGLKKRLSPELWAELEDTYVGAGKAENWEALWKTVALFRRVAIEVGRALGYPYPHDLDHRCVAYFQRIQRLPPGAASFEQA